MKAENIFNRILLGGILFALLLVLCAPMESLSILQLITAKSGVAFMALCVGRNIHQLHDENRI